MKFIKKILVVLFTLIPFLMVSSCGEENLDHYDKITSSLKLIENYEGKHFINDGIGSATLLYATDGDTATFRLSPSGDRVTIRFYCVDTPESTGKVQKWGKTASLFTKGILESATEFVLEANTRPASHDNYGVRYLGYVWYKINANDEFKCLNLELVENGYSQSTSDTGNSRYAIFKEAHDFAKSKALRVWGNEVDPNFSDKPTIVTVQSLRADIYGENSMLYNSDLDSGATVRFEAYVKSHRTEGTTSRTHYYTAAAIGDDGKEYTFTLFGGYDSDSINSYIKVGYLYSFIGGIQKYDGQFQVAIGGTYVPLQSGDKLIKRIQKDYFFTFNSANPSYVDELETAVNSDLTVNNAVVEGTKLTITATTQSSPNGTTNTFTLSVPVEEGFDVSILSGKKISTYGYQKEAGSNQIEVLSFDNITIK